MIRSGLSTLLTLVAVACGADPDQGNRMATEVRDSAGIRIVENARPPQGSRLPWRIGPEPTVVIGVREGDESHMLYMVMDAMMLTDRRILVANGGTHELRVFDEAANHLATWGGRGSGPGEFMSLGEVEPWPGDSIALWYGPRRGISVFDAHGNFGRNFTLEYGAEGPLATFVVPQSVGRDGVILVSEPAHEFDSVEVQIRGPEGRLQASLGTQPGMERYIANEGTAGSMMYPKTFGATVVQAAWSDLFIHSSTGRYEIRAFGGDGILKRIVRMGIVPRAPTQAHVDAYIEEQVAWYPPEMSPSEAEEYQAENRRGYQAVPVAEYLPAFTSVITDRVDHLWVEEFKPPGEEPPSLWTVFDPAGRVLGLVEMPDGLEIHEIGEDYILGTHWDEDGVEYVQLWPLDRTEPDG